MKRQRDYLLPRNQQVIIDHLNDPIYLVAVNRQALNRRVVRIELCRFLFENNIKVLNLGDSLGAGSAEDRDKLVEWRHLHGGAYNDGDTTFPGFRQMFSAIRDHGLRIAKFDLFYGFREESLLDGVVSDELIHFYDDVMKSMKGRFFAVPQKFEEDETSQPAAYMFFFENENDHLVFSSLVDLHIQERGSLFRPAPQPELNLTFADGSVSMSQIGTSIITAQTVSGVLSSISIAKPTITGHLTHNADGTVTITGV